MKNSSEVPNSEKIEQLHKSLRAEHDECLSLENETLNELGPTVHKAEAEKVDVEAELKNAQNVNKKWVNLEQKLREEALKLTEVRKDHQEKERQQRQELANGFQCTIADLKEKIDLQANERFTLAQENEDLKKRFKQLFEQYDRSEKEQEEYKKTQTGTAKNFQERSVEVEREMTRETVREQQAKKFNEELVASEKELRDQLATYTEKLGQFKGSLSKSDEVLKKYKQHKTKSQRRVEQLDKENRELRMKNEKKNAQATKERDKLLKDKEEMQERCKSLQAERQKFLEAKGA